MIDEGQIKEFVGTYDEWLVYEQEKEKRLASLAKGSVPAPKPVQEAPKQEPKKQVQDNNSELKQLQKEHQKKQREFQKLEEQINKLNTEKATLETQLADPTVYADKDKFIKVDEAYRNLNGQLEPLSKQYDKLFEEILTLEEQIG